MFTPDQFLHILTVAISLVAAGIGLYVQSKLATFKTDLIKEINGTYVRTPLFTSLEAIVERLRHWRDHDYRNEIAPLPLVVQSHAQLDKRVDKLETRLDDLASERGDA